MPGTIIRLRDFWSLLPINTGGGSMLTAQLPRSGNTKTLSPPASWSTHPATLLASRPQHHRRCTSTRLDGGVLPAPCSHGMDNTSPGLNYIAGKGLKFKRLFCI